VSIPDLCPHGPDPGPSADTRLITPPQPALRVLLIGSEPVSRVWAGRRLVNPFWRAYIVDRPGLELGHGGERIPYPVDRITVIPAWCPFTFDGADDIGHAFVHVAVPGLTRTAVEHHWPRPYHLDDRALLARLRELGRVVGFGTAGPEAGIEARAIAGLVLAAALRQLEPAPRRELLDPADRRLAPALALIDRELARPIAVAELAALLGVSDEHCIRLFRRQLGQTPAQYIIDRRLLRAAELLGEPDAAIAAVATACGFPNRHYFTRVFSQRLGVTPAAYRDGGR